MAQLQTCVLIEKWSFFLTGNDPLVKVSQDDSEGYLNGTHGTNASLKNYGEPERDEGE